MVSVNDAIYWNPITFHWSKVKASTYCHVMFWKGHGYLKGYMVSNGGEVTCVSSPSNKKQLKTTGVKLPQQMTYQDHNIHNLKYQEELENWSSCWKSLNIRHLPLCQRLVKGAHCLESKTSLDLHPKQWIDENIHLENTKTTMTSLHLFCATSADIAVIHPIESCPKEHDIKSQEWTEQKKQTKPARNQSSSNQQAHSNSKHSYPQDHIRTNRKQNTARFPSKLSTLMTAL